MAKFSKIRPCLWFDGKGEEAAKFYCSIFPNSKITGISHYVAEGKETHGQQPGAVMTVMFELDGQSFMALNGGPHFKFNEAVSLMVSCDTQEELDRYWNALSADPAAEICGGIGREGVPVTVQFLLRDARYHERHCLAKLEIRAAVQCHERSAVNIQHNRHHRAEL